MLVFGAALSLVLIFLTVDPWLDQVGFLAGGFDVHVYRDGAWKIYNDHPLYTETTHRDLSYTYTPFSTLIFLPLLGIPFEAVTNTWLAVNICVLYVCVLLCWRVLGHRLTWRLAGMSALLTATCMFLEPVRTTLYYGQINLVLMALILWDFSRPERGRLRGIGVGLASGIKLVPLYFVAQFLVLRQWRAALVAASTFVLTIVIAWIALPDDSKQYWTKTFFQSDRIAPDTQPANQSIRGTIAHLTGHQVPQWLWLLLAVPVAVGGLLLAAALYNRGERLLTVTVAGLTSCAVSPFSWNHHWVWFLPLFIYLVQRAETSPRWWSAVGFLYLATGAWSYHWNDTWVVVGWFLFPPSWPISQILLNCYVIVYAIIIGCVLYRLRTRPVLSRA
ncbi:glycosyltransferase 87 family protein [Nocardia sp. CDC160]|uniref:glycosyltransferase 87 family protein n=1 Tax=Nocardia sp. CDC160 TaxID=3112166 RepID=UPI002DBEDD4B|nr:glycosyltransferase 87 family protein [Nocardia sp. CDC160]MEC3915753.1 glycosyltransferase 87 family protein [Nocardia sp. CDC160]